MPKRTPEDITLESLRKEQKLLEKQLQILVQSPRTCKRQRVATKRIQNKIHEIDLLVRHRKERLIKQLRKTVEENDKIIEIFNNRLPPDTPNNTLDSSYPNNSDSLQTLSNLNSLSERKRKLKKLEEFITNTSQLSAIEEEVDNFYNSMAEGGLSSTEQPVIDLADELEYPLKNETAEQREERIRAEAELLEEFNRKKAKVQHSPIVPLINTNITVRNTGTIPKQRDQIAEQLIQSHTHDIQTTPKPFSQSDIFIDSINSQTAENKNINTPNNANDSIFTIDDSINISKDKFNTYRSTPARQDFTRKENKKSVTFGETEKIPDFSNNFPTEEYFNDDNLEEVNMANDAKNTISYEQFANANQPVRSTQFRTQTHDDNFDNQTFLINQSQTSFPNHILPNAQRTQVTDIFNQHSNNCCEPNPFNVQTIPNSFGSTTAQPPTPQFMHSNWHNPSNYSGANLYYATNIQPEASNAHFTPHMYTEPNQHSFPNNYTQNSVNWIEPNTHFSHQPNVNFSHLNAYPQNTQSATPIARDSFLRRLRLIPVFTGDSYTNLKSFIEICESLYLSCANHVEEDEFYQQLILSLRREPRTIIKNLQEPSLEKIKDTLVKRFSHLSNKEVLSSQLENLRQNKDETLTQFAERTRKLLNDKISIYDQLSEEQREDFDRMTKRSFCRGISNPKLRERILIKGPVDLNEAISYSIEAEADTVNDLSRNDRFCTYCRISGHLIRL